VLRTESPQGDTPDAAVGTDSRANGITALRLGLALWVLVMHAWPAGGFGADPLTWVTGGRVNGGGSVAVWAFFGLSGFLLASSRQRLPVYAFAWRRALRILPAYWVCIALTAGLVGWWYVEATLNPLGWIGGQRWGGFAANPTDLVNASLWTLPLEIACYIALALVPGRAVRLTANLLAVLLAATAASGWAFGLWLPPVFAFVVGLVLATWRIPIRGPHAFAAAAFAFVVVGSPVGTLVAAAGLVYAMLWLAMWLPVHWRNDLSCVSGDPAPGACRSLPIWAARARAGRRDGNPGHRRRELVHHRASRDLAEVDPTSRHPSSGDGRGSLTRGGLTPTVVAIVGQLEEVPPATSPAGGHDPKRR
jgi:hypothetical protein